jgi:hypothetical protein
MPKDTALFPDEEVSPLQWHGWLRDYCRRKPSKETLPPTRDRWLLSALVWSLFVAACLTPAYADELSASWEAPFTRPIRLGWVALLFGWVPPVCIPWFANACLLGGWIEYLAGRSRQAMWCGLIGLALGCTTFAFLRFIGELLIGYYLWLGSLAAFAIAAFRFHRTVSRHTAEIQADGR